MPAKKYFTDKERIAARKEQWRKRYYSKTLEERTIKSPKRKEYQKVYYQRPEVKERVKKRRSIPEIKERIKQVRKKKLEGRKADTLYMIKRRARFCNTRLKCLYGITLEDKKKMFAQQSGLCKLCNNPLGDITKGCVDHCHKTNKVRGLLHRRCNLLLGFIETIDLKIEDIYNYLNS